MRLAKAARSFRSVVSGTGIRQKSHRFMSQTGLLLLSLILQIFRFSTSLSQLSHQKTILLHSFAIKSSMLNGDCLSPTIDNGHAFLSRYVMLCHASDSRFPQIKIRTSAYTFTGRRGQDWNENIFLGVRALAHLFEFFCQTASSHLFPGWESGVLTLTGASRSFI